MKNQLLTFLLIAFVFNSFGQDSLKLQTTDELGEAVFLAFKKTDFELFGSLLLSESKFNFILNDLDIADSLKQVFRAQGKGAVLHLKSQSKENFNHVLTIAEEYNLNWGKAKIVEIIQESRDQMGIIRSDVTVKIESEGHSYFLFLRSCHKSDTWCIANDVRLSNYSE